ncbi:MAG: hypothetical protein QXY45_00945 [Candidatus Aenigmatarchaeota archaeon]
MIDLKGIALNTIIFTLIALASVVILLFIVNSIIPNFMGKSFCRVYQTIFSLPLTRKLQPNIPGCSLFPETKRIILKEGSCNPGNIAKYIKDCWEKSQQGRGGQTFICFELFMENVQSGFGEDDVKNLIDSQNLRDSIDWKIGTIEGEDLTVIIKYNSEDGLIEVI